MIAMLMTLVGSAWAGPVPARSAAFLELGGNGLFYSVNVERRVHRNLAVSTGLGGLGFREPQTGTSFGYGLNPWRVSALVGRNGHHLEVGAGVTWGVARGDMNQPGKPATFWLVNATSTLGYRYQRDDGGFLFRAGLTPHFGGERFRPLGAALQPWAGASVGWSWGAG